MASYQINLDVLKDSTLANKYIKFQLNNEIPKLLTDMDVGEKNFENTSTAYILKSGYLNANESVSYNLRLWLDEATPAIDEVMNKTFISKLAITAAYVPEGARIHTITFHSLGGGQISDISIPYGEALNEKFPTPNKENDTFLGWVNSFGEIIYPGTIIEEDIELYAWYENQKLILFHSLIDNKVEAYTVNNGETIKNIPTPIREGHTFNGWYTIEGYGPLTSEIPIVENYVLYAVWDEEATVIFDTAGGSLVSPISVPLNTSISNIPIPSKTNSEFLGWYTAEGFGPLTEETVINTSYVLHAKWAENVDIGGQSVLMIENHLRNDEPVVVVSNGINSTKQDSILSGLELSKAGYTAILIDNAGHGNFSVVDNTLFPDLVKLSGEYINTLLKEIKDSSDFDGSKVALLGFSMGGMNSFYQAAFGDIVPYAIVSVNSSPDYIILENADLVYTKYLNGKIEYVDSADIEKINSLLKTYSPVQNISKLSTIPTLLVNATEDEYFPIESIREYVTQVAALGTQTILFELEGENHELSEEGYNLFIPEALSFLSKAFS